MTAGLALFLVFVLAVVCLIISALLPTRAEGEAFAALVLFAMGCAGIVAVAFRLLQVARGWPL